MEDLPELFEKELLKKCLDPTDRALLARVARGFKAAVVASGLPLVRPQLKLKDFLDGSGERLAWAKANRCPWGKNACARAAGEGHLEVLTRMRELDCPWDGHTLLCASNNGHAKVLKWALKNGCPKLKISAVEEEAEDWEEQEPGVEVWGLEEAEAEEEEKEEEDTAEGEKVRPAHTVLRVGPSLL